MSKINDRCTAIAKIRGIENPRIIGKNCNVCGSISRDYMTILMPFANCRYVEPMPDRNVNEIDIDGDKFNLYHLFDDPFIESEYNDMIDFIERYCGSLLLFNKKIKRYHV